MRIRAVQSNVQETYQTLKYGELFRDTRGHDVERTGGNGSGRGHLISLMLTVIASDSNKRQR